MAKRVPITSDLTPDRIQAGTQAYLGSFIEGPEFKRGKDFLAHRNVVIKPEDMPDDFSRALMHAIQTAGYKGVERTPERLARTMWKEGLIQSPETDGASVASTSDQVEALIYAYGKRGVTTFQEFRETEIDFHIMWQERTTKRLPDQIKAIMDEVGVTASDKLVAVKELIEQYMGASPAQIKTYDEAGQDERFDNIPQEKLAQVGKPKFTLPNHWGLNNFVPRLHPGDKIVLSGGTGEGKSAAAMQFAEWCALTGRRVLVIHMEDSIDTILMRQTCRWIPDTTMEELERGDPQGKMARMKALRKQWKANSGGEIVYKYLAGNTIDIILGQMEEVARAMLDEGDPLDVVVFDYFQKVDFDSQVNNNLGYVNVATKGAERLKIWAEAWNAVVFVVSQETPDNFGGKHTAWTKALEQKPQLYISLTRPIIKSTSEEEFVTIDGKRKVVAQVGDRSAFVHMVIKKNNRYSLGSSWCVLDGMHYRLITPEFKKLIDEHPEREFDIPIQKAADAAFLDMQLQKQRVQERVFYEVENPDDRKRQAANNRT
jgi:hypothetical protein